MRIPLKQECHPDSAMPKIPVHQTVNYNQSLNYRLLGRAFHTIKSYLKHSDLRRKIVRNPSLLIQAFSAIGAYVRFIYAGYALIFVHRLP